MGAPARTLPELGTVLAGKYSIVRRIGEGGMGIVYEAMHLRIKQRVAIKMLLPDVMEIPDVVSRFEREARASGQLKSTNAARVLDVEVTEGGIPYMVMEYLEGSDLSAELERRQQLPIVEAVDHVLQTCNAMREAHRLGIIHRDLKPSNLFLTTIEGRPTIKVLDFGISKLEDDREARVTGTQATVGTPLYMSPEQIRSAKHVDARTDIWALGIILFELLAGKTPFEGSTTAAAVAICVDEPPSLRSFRPDVPPELEAIVMRALAKDREARFQSVEAFAVALMPFAPGSTSFAPGSPSASGPIAPVGSRPDLAALARTETSGTDLLAGFKAPPRPGTATSGSWSTGAGGPKKKSAWPIFAVIGGVVLIGGAVAIGAVLRSTASHPSDVPSATTPIPKPTETSTAPTGTPTGSVEPTASVVVPASALPTSKTTGTVPTVKNTGVKPPPPVTSAKPPPSASASAAPTGTGWGPAHL